MGRVFILGGNGFIGKHLAVKLTQFGYTVDTEDLGKDYDFAILLRAVTHTKNSFDPLLIEKNFIEPRSFFERFSDTRIIYASSCSAAFLTNPYALSKMYVEHLGKHHANSMGLRFFNVYGPGNNKGLVKALFDAKFRSVFRVVQPAFVRDYIHVYDVVQSIFEVIDRPDKFFRHGVFDLGTGLPATTMSVCELYSSLSGKNLSFIKDYDGYAHEPVMMFAGLHGELFPFQSAPLTLFEGINNMIKSGV